jgi:hypothetical protein
MKFSELLSPREVVEMSVFSSWNCNFIPGIQNSEEISSHNKHFSKIALGTLSHKRYLTNVFLSSSFEHLSPLFTPEPPLLMWQLNIRHSEFLGIGQRLASEIVRCALLSAASK